MTEPYLSAALERAVSRLPVGPPPINQMIAGATRRRRRTAALFAGGCAAAAVALVGATTVWLGTDPTAPPPSASPPTTSSLVLASPEGVDLVTDGGGSTRLSDRPAAVAYGVRGDVVVLQGSDGDTEVYPPAPGGPIEVWSGGTVRDLPVAAQASSVRLFDAGLVEGRPTALVAERFDEGYPDRAEERLVLVDLDDLTRTVVTSHQAWESGHKSARLLPDGDVIGTLQEGMQVQLVRWSVQTGDATWSTPVAEDQVVDLVVDDLSVAVVQPSFDSRRRYAPTLTVTPHDPVTGEAQPATVIEVTNGDGAFDAGLSCLDRLNASELLCARSSGVPVAVAAAGSFRELSGPVGAVPSVVRRP